MFEEPKGRHQFRFYHMTFYFLRFSRAKLWKKSIISNGNLICCDQTSSFADVAFVRRFLSPWSTSLHIGLKFIRATQWREMTRQLFALTADATFTSTTSKLTLNATTAQKTSSVLKKAVERVLTVQFWWRSTWQYTLVNTHGKSTNIACWHLTPLHVLTYYPETGWVHSGKLHSTLHSGVRGGLDLVHSLPMK